MPDDVKVVVDRATKEMELNRQGVILMAIRRGLELIYGGINNIPVKEWDAFTYNYKPRKQKKTKFKIKLEADESY